MKLKSFILILFFSSFFTNALFSDAAFAEGPYIISGRVIGDVLGNVTMTLTGTITGTVTTNFLGNYSFTGLSDGTYTVTPSLAGYNFSPESRIVHITEADESDINFVSTAIAATWSISGSVSGDIKEGVTMNLTGPITGTVSTNFAGNYTFSGLADGTYTVTPEKNNYSFTPTSRIVTITGANQTGKDFTATQIVKYSISGTVTGEVQAGVSMTLSGTASKVTTTDTSGNYSFTELINGSYTVTPSMPGYIFAPTSQIVKIDNANQTGIDFTSALLTTYSISGRVSGVVQEGVTMILSGDASGTTVTDSAGNYSFTGLSDGTYTVTPSLVGYTFSPSSITRAISDANLTDVNFTSSEAGTYSISGSVTGDIQAGVVMTLEGDIAKTAITDSSGYYSFTGLTNGMYTITPAKDGCIFNPVYRFIEISDVNVVGADFIAALEVSCTDWSDVIDTYTLYVTQPCQ